MADAGATDLSVPFSLRSLPSDYNPNASVGNVDIFDTTNLDAPQTAGNGTVASVWQTLSDTAASAGHTVVNGATEAWDATKSAVSSAVSATESGVGSVWNGLTDKISSVLGSTAFYLLIGLGVLVAALYFVGKSGIIGQAASLKPI